MGDNPQISAPGSGTYDSNTLHVGDGTWDSQRNTFLLPNLQGLNFATMQYNGMGNRFKDLPQYHTLIKGHGILAAITFLGIVPLAIFVARFWWRNPQLALKLHAWLQILTVLTSTVVLVLGYFAVGPERSVSNPHHGIGVAIYVLILFQAIFGAIVRKIEKGRVIWRISIKLMLHQWLGRAIALLAITQVALGLTLYGSPKILFILYTLWVVLLVALWFVFTHRYQGGAVDDGATSYFTNSDGTRTDITHSRRSHSHHGGLVKTAAGVGLVGAALGFLNRRKSQKTEETFTEVTDNRPSGAHQSHHQSHGTSYTGSSFDEKTSIADGREKHTWRDRLLAAGGVAAAFGIGKKLFGKKEKPAQSEFSDYSSGYGPHTASRTELSRLEEGHGPVTPGRVRHSEERISTIAAPAAATAAGAALASTSRIQRQRNRRSGGSITSNSESVSYYSPGREKRKTHGVRNSIAAMGLAGFIKHKFSQRTQRQEDTRIEEIRESDRIQEERMRRRQSQNGAGRLTGDGRIRRHNSHSISDITPVDGSTPGASRHNLGRPLASAAAGAATGAALASASNHQHIDRTRVDERHDIHDSLSSLAPPPPIGGGYHDSHSSGSYDSYGNGPGTAPHRASVGSPPLSIKMRMRDDNGRQHVTLRRLSPAEAAAEREAVRRQRAQGGGGGSGGRGRSNSLSSIGGGDTGDERWRRTEALERQQHEEMQASRQSLPQQQQQLYSATSSPPLPPPPAFPPPQAAASPLSYDGSSLVAPPPPVTGSGMYDTGESAAGSRADSNRRRRRAERASREQQGARVGNRVEFS